MTSYAEEQLEHSLAEDYRRRLTEALKKDGEWLIENAEDIANKIDYQTGMKIEFDYSQPHGYAPEITITTNYINPGALGRIGVGGRKE